MPDFHAIAPGLAIARDIVIETHGMPFSPYWLLLAAATGVLALLTRRARDAKRADADHDQGASA
jgi:hypothetical protein